MRVLERLLLEDFKEWDQQCNTLEQRNLALKVPTINDTITLHQFNCELNDLFTEVQYWFGRAQRNKDAIERIIEIVLKDYYAGKTESARKAAGFQYAQAYPVPESVQPYVEVEKINLFDLEDQIKGYYYQLNSIVKSLQSKSEAKITNNSILNLERSLLPS